MFTASAVPVAREPPAQPSLWWIRAKSSTSKRSNASLKSRFPSFPPPRAGPHRLPPLMAPMMMHAPRVVATVRAVPHSVPHAQRVRQALARHVPRVLAKAPDKHPVAKGRAVAETRQRATPQPAQALAVPFAQARARAAQVKLTALAAPRSLTSNLPAHRLARPACKIRHHEYSS